MLTLFSDESIVSQSTGKSVTLTTHRIRYEYKEWGRSYNQSIMLEHVTSCENHYNSSILLLLLTLGSIGGAIAGAVEEEFGIVALMLLSTIICGILFFLLRSNYIIIGSPSTKMKIYMRGMKKEKVLEFINEVEQAKNNRLIH